MIRPGNSFSQTLALKERPRNSPLVHTEKIAQASVSIWWSYPWVFSQILVIWLFQQSATGSVDECLAQDFQRICESFNRSLPPNRRLPVAGWLCVSEMWTTTSL